MQIIDQYPYRKLERNTQPNGVRHYICPDSGNKLPSVTTILDGTANKTRLLEWRRRVGDKKADQTKHEAVTLGTLLHTHLERYVLGEPRPGGNNYLRLMATRMADQVIQRGLVQIDAVWGSEVMLYVPKLFAGTTDLVARYRGKPAIIDFKTAKTMRSREMIEDYLIQLCAYILCHNELYDTTITTGVIFMVDRDCNFQEFILEGAEFQMKTESWFDRFEQFLAMHK